MVLRGVAEHLQTSDVGQSPAERLHGAHTTYCSAPRALGRGQVYSEYRAWGRVDLRAE